MKKILLGAMTLGLLTACTNDDVYTENLCETSNANAGRRACPSEEIRRDALNSDPTLMERYSSLERATEEYMQNSELGKVLADGTVEIPVVVNVLYRTNAENLSATRIAEQIAVLNADFSGTNTDASKIPAEFKTVAAGNTKVSFRLAKTVRKKTNKTRWSANDAMKRSSTGGIDATTPANYLNIWIVGNMSGILGYATFPESAGLWNDGVVLAAPYVGKTGAASPYNLGRTATHEVGHYLNLRHIWGDGNCATDYVADTPTQQSQNYGKPSYPQYDVCGGVSRSVMFMNYMDYVDDAAMFMFSAGQKTRMNAVTNSSGARAGLRLL